jgi:hypothetical protein
MRNFILSLVTLAALATTASAGWTVVYDFQCGKPVVIYTPDRHTHTYPAPCPYDYRYQPYPHYYPNPSVLYNPGYNRDRDRYVEPLIITNPFCKPLK